MLRNDLYLNIYRVIQEAISQHNGYGVNSLLNGKYLGGVVLDEEVVSQIIKDPNTPPTTDPEDPEQPGGGGVIPGIPTYDGQYPVIPKYNEDGDFIGVDIGDGYLKYWLKYDEEGDVYGFTEDIDNGRIIRDVRIDRDSDGKVIKIWVEREYISPLPKKESDWVPGTINPNTNVWMPSCFNGSDWVKVYPSQPWVYAKWVTPPGQWQIDVTYKFGVKPLGSKNDEIVPKETCPKGLVPLGYDEPPQDTIEPDPGNDNGSWIPPDVPEGDLEDMLKDLDNDCNPTEEVMAISALKEYSEVVPPGESWEEGWDERYAKWDENLKKWVPYSNDHRSDHYAIVLIDKDVNFNTKLTYYPPSGGYLFDPTYDYEDEDLGQMGKVTPYLYKDWKPEGSNRIIKIPKYWKISGNPGQLFRFKEIADASGYRYIFAPLGMDVSESGHIHLWSGIKTQSRPPYEKYKSCLLCTAELYLGEYNPPEEPEPDPDPSDPKPPRIEDPDPSEGGHIHNFDVYWDGWEAVHPHRKYNICTECGATVAIPNSKTRLASCSECAAEGNGHIHDWTSDYTGYESVYPYRQYKVCKVPGCGVTAYTGNKGKVDNDTGEDLPPSGGVLPPPDPPPSSGGGTTPPPFTPKKSNWVAIYESETEPTGYKVESYSPATDKWTNHNGSKYLRGKWKQTSTTSGMWVDQQETSYIPKGTKYDNIARKNVPEEWIVKPPPSSGGGSDNPNPGQDEVIYSHGFLPFKKYNGQVVFGVFSSSWFIPINSIPALDEVLISWMCRKFFLYSRNGSITRLEFGSDSILIGGPNTSLHTTKFDTYVKNNTPGTTNGYFIDPHIY